VGQLHQSIARLQEVLSLPRETPAHTGPKAKVKLDLRGKTDGELGEFAKVHSQMMHDNPDFPFPIPSEDQFDAIAARYQQMLIAALTVQSLARQVTAALDTARTDIQNALRTRGNYVQIASDGIPSKILSTGLAICADATPTGQLEPPQNLIATPTRTSGQLIFTWNAVEGARTYLLQQSDASATERSWVSLPPNSERKLTLSNLPIGQRLAYRIATIGGSTGQSDWSPEIVRMVG
jgi:hypothetical protein